MSFEVSQPGIMTLIQDGGRLGQHAIGLTTGGPLDPEAFALCNRLLQNPVNTTVLEVSFGGLHLLAKVDTFICVTGADMPLRINDRACDSWQVHKVQAGDTVVLDFATAGCRSYLGVAGGFDIAPMFGSSATVMREKIGGLNGDKLQAGDQLPCNEHATRRLLYLARKKQPKYQNRVTLRVTPGYQDHAFSRLQQRRFFSHSYTVSDRCDRMGYRLEGPAIKCDIDGILSEGICYGAIQVPADGQPIVLLNDRQTIGGYPKIGSALSLDAAKLSQLTPGAKVNFAPISIHTAHNALHLARSFSQRLTLDEKKHDRI
ncbi:MAG: biotin-dependent carboxyltransferase family protein [Halioglobus sp.]